MSPIEKLAALAENIKEEAPEIACVLMAFLGALHSGHYPLYVEFAARQAQAYIDACRAEDSRPVA